MTAAVKGAGDVDSNHVPVWTGDPHEFFEVCAGPTPQIRGDETGEDRE